MVAKWEWKKLIFVHLLLLVTAGICFIPPVWKIIHFGEIKAAYFFNSFIQGDLFWVNFWDFLRSATMDWCYDGVILAFALYYIFTRDKQYKKKVIQCFLLVLFTIACFKPIHRGAVKDWTRPMRISPRGELTDLVSMSMVIPGKKKNKFSKYSYPSDHGYTIFMFVIACFFLRGWRFGSLAAFISFPLMISRLVTGTHWVTDVFLGSLPIALFNMAWFFYSPLHAKLTNGSEEFLSQKLFRAK